MLRLNIVIFSSISQGIGAATVESTKVSPICLGRPPTQRDGHLTQNCPFPTKRNQEGGKYIETNFSICLLLLSLLAQLDYSCMPFVREPKLFESFGRGWKIAREIAMPGFLEIQMRIGRNPDERIAKALSWERTNWNQWASCLRPIFEEKSWFPRCVPHDFHPV